MRRIPTVFGLAAISLVTAAAFANPATGASAKLKGVNGEEIGTVALREGEGNGVWINVTFSKLTPGAHGFHIHESGKCEGDFKSAGGHFAPEGNKHGILVEGGPHAGDMPNIHVPSDGRLNVEIFVDKVTLEKGAKNSLFDDDGSAFIVHDGTDDYKSQPSGDAGKRIACGVITE